MTAVQLREELFREMNPLLDNETAMIKMIAFLKKLLIAQAQQSHPAPREGWAAAAKQAHDDGADKLIVDEVFNDETLEGSSRVCFSRGTPVNNTGCIQCSFL